MELQNTNEKILYTMYLTHFLEKAVASCYAEGLIPGTFHLCLGEEASHLAVAFAKQEGDKVLNTHRSHGEALALGISPRELMAEFMGRESSLSRGRGGSMHLACPEKDYIGSNGIVGGNFSVGCGVALALKKSKSQRVCFVVTGEGALSEGSFHESINMACLWKLPIVFICTDNGYGVSTKREKALAGRLDDRIKSYGARLFEADGNDPLASIEAIKNARAEAVGFCPAFVRLKTYRVCGHSKSDKNLYRDESEIASWERLSPISRFESYLKNNNMPLARIDELRQGAIDEIKEATEKAKGYPYPSF